MEWSGQRCSRAFALITDKLPDRPVCYIHSAPTPQIIRRWFCLGPTTQVEANRQQRCGSTFPTIWGFGTALIWGCWAEIICGCHSTPRTRLERRTATGDSNFLQMFQCLNPHSSLPPEWPDRQTQTSYENITSFAEMTKHRENNKKSSRRREKRASHIWPTGTRVTVSNRWRDDRPNTSCFWTERTLHWTQVCDLDRSRSRRIA